MALHANIKLGRKKAAVTKRSSLFDLFVSGEKKSFFHLFQWFVITINSRESYPMTKYEGFYIKPGDNVIKHFTSAIYGFWIKLERLLD